MWDFEKKHITVTIGKIIMEIYGLYDCLRIVLYLAIKMLHTAITHFFRMTTVLLCCDDMHCYHINVKVRINALLNIFFTLFKQATNTAGQEQVIVPE